MQRIGILIVYVVLFGAAEGARAQGAGLVQAVKRGADAGPGDVPAVKGRPVAAPALPMTSPEVGKALRAGRAWLLKNQLPAGHWPHTPGGDDTNYISKSPHSATAVTAVALRALRRSGGIPAAVEKRAKKFLSDDRRVSEIKRTPTNLRLYALAYGLAAAVEMKDARMARLYVEEIRRIHRPAEDKASGTIDGMRYSNTTDMTSFQEALLLLSLQDAKAAGYEVPEEVLEAMKKNMQKMTDGQGGWKYASSSRRGSTLASPGRGPVNELALYRAGGSSRYRLQDQVINFAAQRGEISGLVGAGKKPHDHLYRYSDYFLLFGYYYSSEALKTLPQGAGRRANRPVLRAGGARHDTDREGLARLLGSALLNEARVRRGDGSWNDSDFSGPTWGTAAAMLTLANLNEILVAENE